MKDYLEIKFWQFVKWYIHRGYGYCEKPRELGDGNLSTGCGACHASEVQDWIDGHIDLIKN